MLISNTLIYNNIVLKMNATVLKIVEIHLCVVRTKMDLNFMNLCDVWSHKYAYGFRQSSENGQF